VIVPSADRRAESLDGMVRAPGGEFLMGTEDAVCFPGDGEGPARPMRLNAFHFDVHAVTADRFAEFVDPFEPDGHGLYCTSPPATSGNGAPTGGPWTRSRVR
jgi:formylglycine-generating enzyme required for sulfatase activity